MSANLPLPDWGRFARNPSRTDAQRGDHFLQPDFWLACRLTTLVTGERHGPV
jgi:hypothetical protein